MQQLGRMMRKPPRRTTNSPLNAVYTYFGQFIDHDITRDETPLADACRLSPRQTVNGGGGKLDLHHVYGEGPRSARDSALYQSDGASFLLGKEWPGRPAFDLPYVDGQLLAADDRTGENIILRQICVLFMRLHNLAVDELTARGVAATERFDLARQKVIHQYQWLIMKDFLFRLLEGVEYRRIWESRRRSIQWGKTFSVPVEFSQAAFRFGHSMIRPRYRLTTAPHATNLRTIFAAKRKNKALTPDLAIDWQIFAEGKSKAMSIDTRISPPLFDLPKMPLHHGQPASRHLPRELPVRTLMRGAATRLPTGEEAAKGLGVPALTMQKMQNPKGACWKPLVALGLLGRTPLWYYILLEAELTRNGEGLGKLGSRLVGEVIDGCLRADPNSFYNKAKKRAPRWRGPDGTSRTIGRILELARFVGLG